MIANKQPARLAVITEIISPYRIPAFNLLAEHLGKKFKVFFLGAMSADRKWEINFSNIHFEYEILKGLDLNPRWLNYQFPIYLNFDVLQALRNFSPTKIVLGGYHHVTSLFIYRYAKRFHIPIYLWCESTLGERRWKNSGLEKIKRKIICSFDGYIIPGAASRNYLFYYGVQKAVYLAPNSIDAELFFHKDSVRSNPKKHNFQTSLGLPDFNLLYVGRLSPEKGVDVALNVVKNLQKKQLELGFVIVGDGPKRHVYEQLAKDLKLKHVIFLGFKQQEELPHYYRMSDLFIMPSKSEPWGMVINEALTSGLPILCSPKVGSSMDLVMEGKTGFICSKPCDYENRIEELYAARERLDKMRQHCLSHSMNFFPDKCADGFLNLLKE